MAKVSRNLPTDVHAVLVLRHAGWHGARALKVPANVSIVPMPPYSPELNPLERIWLYLHERFLSLRVIKNYSATVDACCNAWNRPEPLPVSPARDRKAHFIRSPI